MADPMVFLAPDFQQISGSALVTTSPAYEELHQALHTLEDQIATLQAEIADLTARVAALEAAAAP